jgi:hypothetical protein
LGLSVRLNVGSCERKIFVQRYLTKRGTVSSRLYVPVCNGMYCVRSFIGVVACGFRQIPITKSGSNKPAQTARMLAGGGWLDYKYSYESSGLKVHDPSKRQFAVYCLVREFLVRISTAATTSTTMIMGASHLCFLVPYTFLFFSIIDIAFSYLLVSNIICQVT